jgi:hypothetical protein
MRDVGSRYTVDTYKPLFMLQSWAQNFFLTKFSLDVSALHYALSSTITFPFLEIDIGSIANFKSISQP